jgi:hypothetical protein
MPGVITSNPIPAPTPFDLKYTDDHLAFGYLMQESSVDYEVDEGLLQVPVGSPFPSGSPQLPCKIVRVHAPIQRKIVTYTYARRDLPPLIPKPETTDSNLRLLKHVRLFWGYTEIAPGVHVHLRTGEYHYAVVTPLTTQDRMPGTDNPAYKPQTRQDYAAAGDYSDSIIVT